MIQQRARTSTRARDRRVDGGRPSRWRRLYLTKPESAFTRRSRSRATSRWCWPLPWTILAHPPVFGKLFLETECAGDVFTVAEGAAILPRIPVPGPCTCEHGRRTQSAVEGETDRARFLGRGRGPEDPIALDGRPLTGTTGATLDPILSLRQRIRLAPGGFARVSFATGLATDREAANALCMKYADPSSAPRTFALASTQGGIALRHLGIPVEEAQLYERLASRVLYTDRSLGASAAVRARNLLGQSGLWSHGISGDLPILLVRVLEPDDVPLVRQVLRAQDYWRLKGLSADVVILNEHPVSYRNAIHEQLGDLLEGGPWGAWKKGPGCVPDSGDGLRDADHDLSRRGARGSERERGTSRSPRTPLRRAEWPPARSARVFGDGTRSIRCRIECRSLTHWHGRGGFTADGREYAIVLNGAEQTHCRGSTCCESALRTVVRRPVPPTRGPRTVARMSHAFGTIR